MTDILEMNPYAAARDTLDNLVDHGKITIGDDLNGRHKTFRTAMEKGTPIGEAFKASLEGLSSYVQTDAMTDFKRHLKRPPSESQGKASSFKERVKQAGKTTAEALDPRGLKKAKTTEGKQ